MKIKNLVLGVALVALMAACGSKQETATETTATATESTTEVVAESETVEAPAAEPVKEEPKAEKKEAKKEVKKEEAKKDDGCEKKVAAFESYAARLADAKARKAQGPAAIKEYAALVKEAPTQKANVESCKTSDALKKRCATALLKINANLQ
mgnify:CR=1 FL=1